MNRSSLTRSVVATIKHQHSTTTTADLGLVAAAREAITARYRPDWHVVGAALRTRSGRVFTGVHLEATVGRIALCAEAVALGRAATEAGDTEVDTIVAVYHPGPDAADQTARVVAPCGMCRELIADYAPNARVLVPATTALRWYNPSAR